MRLGCRKHVEIQIHSVVLGSGSSYWVIWNSVWHHPSRSVSTVSFLLNSELLAPPLNFVFKPCICNFCLHNYCAYASIFFLVATATLCPYYQYICTNPWLLIYQPLLSLPVINLIPMAGDFSLITKRCPAFTFAATTCLCSESRQLITTN